MAQKKSASIMFPVIALAVLIVIVAPIGYLIGTKSHEPAVSDIDAPRTPPQTKPFDQGKPANAPRQAAAPRIVPPSAEAPAPSEHAFNEAEYRDPKVDSDPDGVERDAPPEAIAKRDDDEKRIRQMRDTTAIELNRKD